MWRPRSASCSTACLMLPSGLNRAGRLSWIEPDQTVIPGRNPVSPSPQGPETGFLVRTHALSLLFQPLLHRLQPVEVPALVVAFPLVLVGELVVREPHLRAALRRVELPMHARVRPLFRPVRLPPRVFERVGFLDADELPRGLAAEERVLAPDLQADLDRPAHPRFDGPGAGQSRPHFLDGRGNRHFLGNFGHGQAPLRYDGGRGGKCAEFLLQTSQVSRSAPAAMRGGVETGEISKANPSARTR